MRRGTLGLIDAAFTGVGTNVASGVLPTVPTDRSLVSCARIEAGTLEDGAGATVRGSAGAENVLDIGGVNTTGHGSSPTEALLRVRD